MNDPATVPSSPSYRTDNSASILRFLLREAVRANPLYVISAACIAYAVLQLNAEINPQTGKIAGIGAILGLLQTYELAVLAVFTVVMQRRQREGGRDMHGLAIVAALFMGGSFIALDELVVNRFALGAWLLLAGIVLATFKLAWYARQPGVNLPLRYRLTMLGIFAGCALGPFFGSQEAKDFIRADLARELAWLCGMLPLWSILALFAIEIRNRRLAGQTAPTRFSFETQRDKLVTSWCGVWAVGVAAATGVTHLISSDWVLDLPVQRARFIPVVLLLISCFILLRWIFRRRIGWSDAWLAMMPLLAMSYFASDALDDNFEITAPILLGPPAQVWATCLICGLALGRLTGSPLFYIGAVPPILAPFTMLGWRVRDSIPHLRVWLSTLGGFALLGLGMMVSIFRERWLRALDHKDEPTTPPPSEA